MSDASAGLQDSARANARSPLSTVMRARAGIKVRIKDCTLTPFYNAKMWRQFFFYVRPGYGLHVEMNLQPSY